MISIPILHVRNRVAIAMLMGGLTGSCQSNHRGDRLNPPPYELVRIHPPMQLCDTMQRTYISMRTEGAFETICTVTIDYLYANGWWRAADVSDMMGGFDVPRWGGVFKRSGWIVEIWIAGGMEVQSTKEIRVFTWADTPAGALECLAEGLAVHMNASTMDMTERVDGMNDVSEKSVLRRLWLYELQTVQRVAGKESEADLAADSPYNGLTED